MLNNKGVITLDPIATLGIAVIIAVVIIVSYGIYKNSELDRQYIQSGYTKKVLPGSPVAQWVKPEEFVRIGQLYPEK